MNKKTDFEEPSKHYEKNPLGNRAFFKSLR